MSLDLYVSWAPAVYGAFIREGREGSMYRLSLVNIDLSQLEGLALDFDFHEPFDNSLYIYHMTCMIGLLYSW